MNLIRKLKLKAMLRNCDYVLAGTVIKQQYYDESKNTEINRLIDQFMANPGFEEALKLIEYNEMMVFYFTESCEGGLYVRKGVQSTASRQAGGEYGADEPAGYTGPAAGMGRAGDEKVTPFFESLPGEASLPPVKEEAEEESAGAAEPAAESETEAKPDEEKPLTDYQKKLKESEEWMEQMIERLSRKNNKSRTYARLDPTESAPEPFGASKSAEQTDFDFRRSSFADKTETGPSSFEVRESADSAAAWSDASEAAVPATSGSFIEAEPSPSEHGWEPGAGTADKQEPSPFAANTGENAQQEQAADDELDHVFRHAGADKAMRSLQEKDVSAPAGGAQTYDEDAVTETFDEPFSPTSVDRYDDSLEDTLVYETGRKPEARPKEAVNEPKERPDFSNVIATLKIDIHTMTQQIEEYRHQLTYYTPNEKQIRGWIRSLEAAIAEFSQAIDLLEGED